MKRNLEIAGMILGLVLAASSAVKAFYLLPYQVAQLECAQRTADQEKRTDHELLVRIEERLIYVQEKIAVLNDKAKQQSTKSAHE
jgi:hypothetical protein